ncbi:DUF4411 family protein [Pseudoxanthomonas suwonensis]|uniref:DUF4411 family protein n=1 Tax=Pseudoxanthomonas suwonensis TaxID=314722 RepID=UPI000465DE50|nr:DUF4411 family protein [Pseudoxanthomonas suwonensis]
MDEKFIVDANVFVQGKNFHYNFDFCEGFWDWIRAGFDEGLIYSIRKVRSELVEGKQGDKARAWAEAMPPEFFLEDEDDSSVMAAYAEVMQWAAASTHYSERAKQEFAEVKRADAFLLAYAKRYGFVIVTQEQSKPEQKKRIPIPDAANSIGGIKPTLTIYELLRRHAKPTFVFNP